ncbi:MAG: hypothetical protein Q9M97_04005 [Candidatus Gracilibacteria bacterium]|nr:hypothetical protein [Candidatus Gracilibacteria bacterium]
MIEAQEHKPGKLTGQLLLILNDTINNNTWVDIKGLEIESMINDTENTVILEELNYILPSLKNYKNKESNGNNLKLENIFDLIIKKLLYKIKTFSAFEVEIKESEGKGFNSIEKRRLFLKSIR